MEGVGARDKTDWRGIGDPFERWGQEAGGQWATSRPLSSREAPQSKIERRARLGNQCRSWLGNRVSGKFSGQSVERPQTNCPRRPAAFRG
uniref:Uncharacterized protein n=1 Tax=Plectus sambesii TaxID=2011161 RepID=A0A914UXS9_9BILA